MGLICGRQNSLKGLAKDVTKRQRAPATGLNIGESCRESVFDSVVLSSNGTYTFVEQTAKSKNPEDEHNLLGGSWKSTSTDADSIDI